MELELRPRTSRASASPTARAARLPRHRLQRPHGDLRDHDRRGDRCGDADRGASSDAIRDQARREGMRTLREAGLLAIFDGRTTVEEVLRETSDDADERRPGPRAAREDDDGRRCPRRCEGREAAAGGRAGAPGRRHGEPRKRRGGRVSVKALTQFTIQLATLQDAGIPIVSSLQDPRGPARPRGRSRRCSPTYRGRQSGTPLSEALAKHPQVFDDLYSNMVRAGEAGGVLDVSSRASRASWRRPPPGKKVKGAMIYPAVVVHGHARDPAPDHGLRGAQVRERLQAAPGHRRAARDHAGAPGFSKFLMKRWYVLLMASSSLVIAFKRSGGRARGRRFFDRLRLGPPDRGAASPARSWWRASRARSAP